MAITIPRNELNEFSLPRVCVATGQPGAVTFQKVEFQYVPKWIAVFAMAPLLYLIFYFMLRKTASGTLPFSDETWSNLKTARRNVLLAVAGLVGAVFLGVALMAAFDDVGGLLFFVLIIASIIAIGVATRKVRKLYPTVTRIDERDVHLKFPSTQAEDLVRAHLSAGARPVA